MSNLWNNNTLEDEIQRNSLEYGMAVNSDRSIPDAKSGLKPVARRILYDAFVDGHVSNKPHVKSARVVGDTMGKYHPHGDTSIYGAMIRLAQDWVMRYPLIDIHGNKGNIMGDGPASMRYTEARLAKISEDGLLGGLKKKNVDFTPTYDESREEPVTLPSIFPNLLCNPNEGIGWAMGCSWAPHNLREVGKAITDYLEGMEPTLPGPDFPTGGVIINKDDIPAIMRTGRGSVRVRGKYKIEKQNIVFYELPYGTRLEALMTEIGKACDEEKITNVADIRNETNAKKGIRLVIEADKGVVPETVVVQLFAKTNLQTSFSYNQIALVGKTPTELSLKDAIEVYVNHNIDCMVREATFDMNKALDRFHIVEGLLKALEDIDNIIALIKKSDSAAAAKIELINRYRFTEIQAKAILDMKLAKLANLEKVELQDERAELNDTVEKLDAFINNDSLQKVELKSRLNVIVNKYGDDRRTELTQVALPKKEEREIAEVIPEDCVVVTTKSGLIKRVSSSSFKPQRRGGKGVKTADDIVLDMVKTNTIDTMLFFTNKGKMYRTVVDNIPVGNNTARGTLISSLVKLEKDEIVVAVTSLHRKTTPEFVIFITKDGMVKKTKLEEYFKTNRNNGILAIKLKENDTVADILLMDKEPIVLITKKGMGIKFATDGISPIGRLAAGVKGIKLAEDDEVIVGLPVHKDTDYLGLFIKKGIGKKISLNDITLQGRGGKGVMVYNKEEVAGAAMIDDDDLLLLNSLTNSICISAKEVPLVNRTAIGNLLIKGGNLNSIVKI